MNRSRSKPAILLFFCISLLVTVLNARAAEQSERTYSLLIYGSGGIGNWDQNFNSRLSELLGSDFGQYFTPEFLPLVAANEQDLAIIAYSLALKHSNKKIGLVVALLEEANVFVKDWGEVFAPDARILSVLPSDDFFSENHQDQNTLFLTSAIDEALAGSTELLPQMFPDLERIYLVGGAGAGDLAYMQRYRNSLEQLDLPYELNFLSGFTPDELVQELAMVPANSAVMTTTYDIDRLGRPYRSALIAERLTEDLALPVLAMTDQQIPAGAIGGLVTSVDAYALNTEQLIRSLTADENFTSDPVSSGTEYMFNGEQLDRFGINRAILPANSLIVNEVPNVWRDYRNWILGGLTIIVIQGLLIGALLQARHRRILAEAQLERAHKMEALGTLAGGIAHDFNNVLMSITANTELVSFRAQNDSEIQQRLDKIMSASKRAKNLVTQILMFSRQSYNSKQDAVAIEQLVHEYMEQIQSSSITFCEIKVQAEDDLPNVIGDQSQLYQVIMNVCLNAQQAMQGNGVIVIHLKSLELSSPKSLSRGEIPAGDYVEMTITDSGVGIAPKDLQHIFEPFFTTKPHGEGTGLGLALVYQIVKSHRGFIDVVSSPGSGTSVSIFLPAVAAQEMAETEEEPERIASGRNEHILVVDDDELVLDSIIQVFGKLGYKVTAHTSSVAALQEFEKDPDAFDLVFSDISMPEMDGVRLVENMRSKNPELPVILCTGYLEVFNPDDVKEFTVLRKPSSASEISLAVEAELNKHNS
jgi:signal transduction histidine kinase/ActR/RegA family two-component response regulator